MAQEGNRDMDSLNHAQILQIALKGSRTMSGLTLLQVVFLFLALYYILGLIPHIYLTRSLFFYAHADWQKCEHAAAKVRRWPWSAIPPNEWIRGRGKLVPPRSMATALMGIALFKQGRIAESYPYLSSTVIQDLSNFDEALLADLHLSAGIAALSLGYYEEACVYLRRAAKAHPVKAQAWYHLGEALYSLHNGEAAQSVWRAVIKEGKEPWSTHAKKRLRDALLR